MAPELRFISFGEKATSEAREKSSLRANPNGHPRPGIKTRGPGRRPLLGSGGLAPPEELLGREIHKSLYLLPPKGNAKTVRKREKRKGKKPNNFGPRNETRINHE